MVHQPNPIGRLLLRTPQFIHPYSQKPSLSRIGRRSPLHAGQTAAKQAQQPTAGSQTDRPLEHKFQEPADRARAILLPRRRLYLGRDLGGSGRAQPAAFFSSASSLSKSAIRRCRSSANIRQCLRLFSTART